MARGALTVIIERFPRTARLSHVRIIVFRLPYRERLQLNRLRRGETRFDFVARRGDLLRANLD
jgi:hypothetical protein